MAAFSSWLSGLLVVGVASAVAFGCGGVGNLVVEGSDAGTSTTTSGGTGGSAGATGVPCDVAAALSACVSCHSDPPIAGAQGSLVTYADLTAMAPADPLRPPTTGDTMAQMALVRLMDTTRPMPPTGVTPPTAAQIATLQAWVTAGTPMGTCGVDAGTPDPTFTGPAVCASKMYSGFTGDGSSRMTPGEACIACHSKGEGPRFAIGGTVFPTGHAPNDCVPTAAEAIELQAATVVITDANNQVLTLSVDSVGNFNSSRSAVTFPIHAKVVYMGKERPMLTAQTSGDCNACHTEAGTNNAPGRVALPN
jgi:cytochrome c553